MSARDAERWNEKYERRDSPSTAHPDEWLVESLRLIRAEDGTTDPGQRALDIACGLGHNAVWLAQQGWQSDAVDISPRGLQLAQGLSAANEVDVRWIEADLDSWTPDAHEYDVVVVFRFLDRERLPPIVRTALRPGGWLIYETFSSGQCDRPDSHIRNPAFTLAPDELCTFFPDFDVVVHREDVLADRTVQRFLGRRNEAE